MGKATRCKLFQVKNYVQNKKIIATKSQRVFTTERAQFLCVFMAIKFTIQDFVVH